MRKWCKNLGVLAGSLLGLGGLLGPAHAQFGAGLPSGPGIFADDPHQGTPPDFPNPGTGGSEQKVSPFSLRDDGAPNAFTIQEAPPATYPYSMTFRGEYLGWWVSHINIPAPLATGSTANPLTATDFGALGQPSTNVLLGAGPQSYGMLNGGRATFGFAPGFLPPIEVSGLTFNRDVTLLDANSAGGTTIARPVQLLTAPTITGAASESAYLVAGPGFGVGGLTITSSLSLWGIDTNMFYNIADNGTIQIDLSGGFKYLDMSERFHIADNYDAGVPTAFNAMPGGLPAGVPVSIFDDFFTRNQFSGGTIGARTRMNWGPVMLSADTRLSLGSTFQYLSINGNTTIGGGSGGLTQGGGILALPSNMGNLSQHAFSVVPELNVTLSYQVTKNVRIFAGYNLLYWTNVIRAADQIQTAIDPRQVPTDFTFAPGNIGIGPNAPFRTSNFFANGVAGGLEFGF